MDQPSAPVAQSPASATPAPGQPIAAQAPAATSGGPISEAQADFLRAKRSALSNQLESVQERRDEVAGELRNADTQASERPGLESRLKVLDERLIQIERDMAINSGELANAPARSRSQEGGSTAPSNGRGGFRGANSNLLTVAGFLLLLPLAVQFARRKFGPASARFDRQAQADAAALRERMDRMDSALDAVAIEVERIGEGQRFLTQAMTGNGGAGLGGVAPAFEGAALRDRNAAELR